MKELIYDQWGPNEELRVFIDAHPWVCPQCGGTGEYESGYGPRGCGPCCSRLLFFVDEAGNTQSLDWGDKLIIEDDGSYRIERGVEEDRPYKPLYIVRFPNGRHDLCDSLVEAIERRRGTGIVYERLGHAIARKIDVDDALLAAAEEALAAIDEAYDATGYFKVAPESEQRTKIESAIAAAKQYRAAIERVWKQNEAAADDGKPLTPPPQ